MDNPSRYAARPLAFLACYVRARPCSHAAIMMAVVGAVGCSVGAQYAVKVLVDTLAGGLYVGTNARDAWLEFLLLATLIAVDNLLWRVASWIASYTFVAVTGDLRRDLFRHLTGHAPSYFADRMPGTLTSRVTATSNAVFTLQNMSVWNVLPPCMATLIAIAFVVTVSLPMAAVLMALAGILVLAMFRLAGAGRPLHHEFADRAAAVDGEMVDVVGNMPLVWSFCGIGREHRRLDATIDREMTARRRIRERRLLLSRRAQGIQQFQPAYRARPARRSRRPVGLRQVDSVRVAAAFLRPAGGRILLGGQDIARVTQESLRAAIAVVPQ